MIYCCLTFLSESPLILFSPIRGGQVVGLLGILYEMKPANCHHPWGQRHHLKKKKKRHHLTYFFLRFTGASSVESGLHGVTLCNILQYSVANAKMEKCELSPEFCYRYMKNSENKSDESLQYAPFLFHKDGRGHSMIFIFGKTE